MRDRIPVHAALAGLLLLAGGCGLGDRPADPSGTFEAVEVDVAPSLPGRVLEVRCTEGARVAAGDTLLLLDTETLALQRADAEAGRQTLAAERRIAAAALAQARTQQSWTETEHARVEALVAAGSAAQRSLEEIAAQRDMARSQAAAAANRLSLLDAQDARLTASLAVFDRQLRDGVVTAPISGTVTIRAVEPGEMAAPGRTALRLADLSRLELRVFLAAPDLAGIRLGQELPVRVDALPEESLTGTVSWISSEAEFTPKNVQTRDARAQLVYAVKLRVANPDGRLHLGMPAEAKIP